MNQTSRYSTFRCAHPHKAIVTVAVLPEIPSSQRQSIECLESAFQWVEKATDGIPIDAEMKNWLQQEAIEGVRYALHNARQPIVQKVCIQIHSVLFHPDSGNGEEIFFAACMATWNALADPGTNHPQLRSVSALPIHAPKVSETP